MRKLAGIFLFIFLGAAGLSGATTPSVPYLTEPALSPDGSTIAFASGGAIWTVPAKGGEAHLLIAGSHNASSPLYSPDGTRLGFVSDQSGAANIYLLDFRTGSVKRLTYDDAGVELDAWSRDGKWIYFSSTSHNIIYMDSIYRVSADGGTPLPVTAELYINEHYGAPSPNGTELAFTGHGVANWQWWRKGHSHLDDSEIWLLDEKSGRHYTQISQGGAEELWPMWGAQGRDVYYVSDRTGTANIWVRTLGAATRQVTHFTDGRLVWPRISYDGKSIVFARHFGIWKLAARSGKAAEVPITLRGAPVRAGVEHEVFTEHFTDLALSPDGKKIAFIAHGSIFASSAAKPGRALRISDSSADHSDLAWSPDSKKLVFVSDRNGEPHLYLYDFSRRRQTELVSQGEDYEPVFSPDGKTIAFKRDGHELCSLAVATKQLRVLAQANFDLPPISDPHSIAWSPDSRWIAYASYGPRMFRNIRVVSAAGGPSHEITFLGNVEGRGPVWGPDGQFLLYVTGQRTKVLQVARIDLIPRAPQFVENQFWDLFEEANPQGKRAAASSGGKSGESTAAAKKIAPVKIAFEGIRQRLSFLPIGLDVNRVAVSPDGKQIVVTARVAGQENLYLYPIDELRKKPAVARQLTSTPGAKNDAQFSPDGKRVFYLDRGKIFEATLGAHGSKPLAVAAEMDVNFAREKLEVFDQAWRYLRDNFWNPRMNGVNWDAVHAEYEPLVAGANTPDELYGLMSLMVGELNSSHSGVYPPRGRTKPSEGRMGVSFDAGVYERSGVLRVSSVVPHGPAALAGVKAGDEILSVDGVSIAAHTNFHELLDHRIGHMVTLKLGGPDPRAVDVKPVNTADLKKLIYRQWVERNRAYVAKLSGGRLGYVHLQAMEPGDLQHLAEELDSETQNLAGVVIDIRNNEGGFVNPYAIDVLARRGYLIMEPRGLPNVPMRIASGEQALERPTILVVNRGTLSDGEDFTEGYRALHLGKVVGEPTAGWIIYTWGARLMDGSVVRLPHARVVTEEGQPMEMHPRPVDIPVARPIGETYEGKDSRLRAAVRVLLSEIAGKAKAH